MYNRPIILFPLALLTILALLTFWINRSVHPPQHRPDSNNRHDPDYILNNFVTTKTDQYGNVLYVLHAAEMKHFPDDDSTELKLPKLVQYTDGKPNTHITSKRGLVSSNGEQVQFMDDVVLVREAYADRGEMTLLTQYLKVTPDSGVATTDKPVVIKQAPKTVIHGTGMIYNKKQQTIQLLNNARVHYVRPAVTKKSGVKPKARSGSKNSTRSKPVNQQRKATRN